MTFENISFDIRRMVQGVITLMKGHATQKGIELISNIDDNLPRYVRGDPNRLRQVLLNLTGNAVKFTDEGNVTLSVQLVKERSIDGQYEIYFGVADSGIGISKEAQKNLFKPFSQADSSISRKFGGTGLGLAISKGVIEAMDSSININSDVGSGSTFFFTLNMKEGQSKDAVSENKSSAKEPDKVVKVLVVDDNDINQKVVAGFLEKKTYNIDKAYNAETAIEKVKQQSYDVILMDIQLPRMKGDEATKQIREFNKNIPIIALTGNLMESDIENYKKAGMNGFIEKPIDPDKLNQTLVNIDSLSNNASISTKPDTQEKSEPSEEEILNSETLDTLKEHLKQNEIKEMIRDLVTKSNEIISSSQIALEQNDTEALCQRGHELKGMAGNFGLIELSNLAGDLEQKAKREEAILVLSSITNTLPEAQKRAEKALSAWLNKNAE
jgi:CheY-like chemotaxis protein